MDREEEIKKLKDLNYEDFKKLAKDPNLSDYQKIGFPNSYRKGYEKNILQDILNKIPIIENRSELKIFDIGPGCSSLVNDFLKICYEKNHDIYLADSEEMLNQLPDGDYIHKVAGYYPKDHLEFINDSKNRFDCIISYSVFHYIFKEGDVFSFLDKTLSLLKPNGYFLLGDIPNINKRSRFFSSEQGVKFHQEFTSTDSLPEKNLYELNEGVIDDGIITSIFSRYRNFGFEVYILPQPETLPMYNRREDILIRKW